MSFKTRIALARGTPGLVPLLLPALRGPGESRPSSVAVVDPNVFRKSDNIALVAQLVLGARNTDGASESAKTDEARRDPDPLLDLSPLEDEPAFIHTWFTRGMRTGHLERELGAWKLRKNEVDTRVTSALALLPARLGLDATARQLAVYASKSGYVLSRMGHTYMTDPLSVARGVSVDARADLFLRDIPGRYSFQEVTTYYMKLLELVVGSADDARKLLARFIAAWKPEYSGTPRPDLVPITRGLVPWDDPATIDVELSRMNEMHLLLDRFAPDASIRKSEGDDSD